MDEIEDMKATAEQFELSEQEGAADQLPQIVAKARNLAGELNDLCNSSTRCPVRWPARANRRDVAPTSRAIRELLRSDLTIRDVAELFRAHPRAIEALLAELTREPASSHGDPRLGGGFFLVICARLDCTVLCGVEHTSMSFPFPLCKVVASHAWQTIVRELRNAWSANMLQLGRSSKRPTRS